MEPAELLRLARKRHCLTQAELAARAGTSQPVISAYEHGHRDPTTHTLRRLIAATGDRLELRLRPDSGTVTPHFCPDEHARRLVDVLLLADAIGHRERRPAAVVRFDST